MSIVMGLDQHRAQITADWLDTDTGEVKRVCVAPADRAGVRKFLARFRGAELEVSLEATTGWRFVVEEGGINRSSQRWLGEMIADTRPAPRRVSSSRVSFEGGC